MSYSLLMLDIDTSFTTEWIEWIGILLFNRYQIIDVIPCYRLTTYLVLGLQKYDPNNTPLLFRRLYEWNLV